MFVGMKSQNELDLNICGAVVRLIMWVYSDKIWDAGEKFFYEEFDLCVLFGAVECDGLCCNHSETSGHIWIELHCKAIK